MSIDALSLDDSDSNFSFSDAQEFSKSLLQHPFMEKKIAHLVRLAEKEVCLTDLGKNLIGNLNSSWHRAWDAASKTYLAAQQFLEDPIFPTSKESTSFAYTSPGKKIPHCGIGVINGMNTSLEKLESNIQYFTEFFPEISLDCVYNRTHGFFVDAAEILNLNFEGVSLITSNLLLENWTLFHEENRDNPAAKYLQFCHSQGSIHTVNALKRASSEIRDRLIIVAIAPAKLVPKELCYQSYNYASESDLVPYIELFYAGLYDLRRFGLSKRFNETRKNWDQFNFLPAHPDAERVDHSVQSPTYKNVIESHAADYLKVYASAHSGDHSQSVAQESKDLAQTLK